MTPSPLTQFTATITLMGEQRKAIQGAVTSESDWRILLEDLAMLTQENVVIGLRSKWVRRVAVPMLMADRVLRGQDGNQPGRAEKALEILDQITSTDENVVALKKACIHWIKTVYNAPATGGSTC